MKKIIGLLRKRAVLMSVFLLSTTAIFAQQKITGVVRDALNDPLAGVTVTIKGTTKGTVTDITGAYTIEVAGSNSVLEFTYIGFVPQQITAGNQTVINVTMEEDTRALEEIVVVGYGTVKKSDLTGSVSSIKSEELQKLPMTSLDQGIQGRAAGVQVVSASGAPGAQISIRVRGGNSLSSGNGPLFVIDGFPIAAGSMASAYQSGSLANNGMATINPNDVESIEILKDASATAIYGSRGANGVVLITTKRGKTGKTKVSYDGYFGVQNITKKMDMMNGEEFATMSNIAAANAGLAPLYGGADEKWKDPSYYRNNSTDWQDLIFREALMHNHQVSINGGSESTQFAITGNYFDQEGIVINSDLKRASLRANVDTKLSHWVTVQTSLTAGRTFSNVAFSEGDGGGTAGGVINGALALPPTMYVYNDDGSLSTMNQTPYGTTTGNPYGLAKLSKDYSTIDRVMANVSVKFNLNMILKGLGLEIRGGTDYSNAFRDVYYPSTVLQGESFNGVASKSWNRSTSYLNENLLTYSARIGDHSINATGGLTLQTFEYLGGQSTVSGFVNDLLEDNSMGSAGVVMGVPSSWRNTPRQASWLGRINYNYADRYLVTLTGRADGSSKFGANNKWGFFPSAAVAWRVSEEAFMEDADWLNNLKLRVSYGLAGNQEFSNFASLASLAQYSYNLGGVKATGFAPNKIPNSNLKWETTSTFDAGLDFGMFNNRLTLTADFYNKNTDNLLWDVSIPLSSGFGSIFSNNGTIRNWGIELGLNYDLITNNNPGAFTWNTGLMYSMNRNKVVSLPDFTPGRPGGYLSGHLRVDGSWLEEGYPVGIWNYYVYDGVFETQEMLDATIVNSSGETVAKHPKALTNDGLGSPKFKDLNQDGKIDREDWAIIGDPNPDFIFSWTNNFSYKNFDFNIFINGSYGNDILQLGRGEYAMIVPSSSQRRDMLNYWTPTNTQTNIPAPRTAAHAYLPLSSWMIEDGSYIRLKNVVLGYRFPIKKSIESLRLYMSAQNLLTLTDYSGFDPEVSSKGGSNLQPGVDWNPYPVSRVFTLGVNIVF
ncbi:MAG: TonB-dependent receptor [Tannerella sp.]|jgi:TonB-linked SusC/RagA family outer membrane protein|nr:TonB-dependent receptor [Tannerella sp.]